MDPDTLNMLCGALALFVGLWRASCEHVTHLDLTGRADG